MSEQRIFWDYEEHLGTILTRRDDPLEKLAATVDFERFRPILEQAAGRSRVAKGGRPALDAVLKFRMLVLQSLHNLSMDATEHMVRDRLTWLHFCGLKPHDTVPDANTLWDFREALIKADALEALFGELNRIIAEAGFISRSGQIVDSSLVAAPRQRATEAEKAAIKAGRPAGEIWPDGRKLVDIAVPVYGYKTHISIDRKHGIIRRQIVTDAAANDGKRLREGLIEAIPVATCGATPGNALRRTRSGSRRTG